MPSVGAWALKYLRIPGAVQHVAQRSDALQNRDRYELGVRDGPGSAAHRFTLRRIREATSMCFPPCIRLTPGHTSSFSRCGFLFAPELCGTPFPKTPPHSDLRQMNPAVDRPDCITIGHGARNNERNKKEAERRKAQLNRRTCKVRRASSGTRTPSGVPQRLSPRGLSSPKAQRQAMLSRTVRSVRSGTAAPTGGRRPRAAPRALPAPENNCPSAASTSRAGRCAGRMMPEPPECRGDEPFARRHRTPLRRPE
jgi:hypothetical protein